MSPLIFWQNIPSIHQAPLLRSVARFWPGEVLVVTEGDISVQRLQQGWQRPDFSPARLIVSPSREERRELVSMYGGKGAVHVFSGLHAYPETYWTLKQVSRTQATVGVVVESGQHNDGFRAVLRRLIYTIQSLKWGRRLSFILPSGALGENWYRRCGFPLQRIYPFGYFVKSLAGDELGTNRIIESSEKKGIIKFLFVGQIIERKGIDLLFQALQLERHRSWRLDIVGDGAKLCQYKQLASDLGIEDRVQWLGVLQNTEVQLRMAQADKLILPSRFDGWGAVVNEALISGTPVIISDACGAADLIRASWRGRVFKSGSVVSLREALVADMQPVLDDTRTRIKSWAKETIAPDVAARYMLEIIRYSQLGGSRPNAPWRKN
jgi:glycosyltransferase involved in cell wall biosynthesis